MKLLLVSDSGGVLLDLLALERWWSRHDTVWHAVSAVDTRSVLAAQSVRWVSEIRAARWWRLPRAITRALAALRDERPDVLVSAGAGVAIAYFVAARRLGVPSVWIETWNAVEPSGISSRICARLASVVLVQQRELEARRRSALYVGPLY
jgi:UDP-N-acetylglucosamine:LPS N-acetylglucosamine transferase